MVAMMRSAALGSFGALSLFSAGHAQAQRGIVIDNNASNCGGTCTSYAGVQIGSNGSISVDGNTFFAADSGTLYRALTGYTTINTASGQQRLDFVSFYTFDRSITANAVGNVPDPNFQIQFARSLSGELSISYAYQNPTSIFGGNLIPQGAKIGYSGILPGSGVTVLNENGLLLGSNSNLGTFLDSTFNFTLTNGVVRSDIVTRYAAAPSVPEPATWALMLLGFAAVGMQLRRRHSPHLSAA